MSHPEPADELSDRVRLWRFRLWPLGPFLGMFLGTYLLLEVIRLILA